MSEADSYGYDPANRGDEPELDPAFHAQVETCRAIATQGWPVSDDPRDALTFTAGMAVALHLVGAGVITPDAADLL